MASFPELSSSFLLYGSYVLVLGMWARYFRDGTLSKAHHAQVEREARTRV